jgi:hypothetical protein
MTVELSSKDPDFILTSLQYTRQRFQDTVDDSLDFKNERLEDVNRVMAKVRALKAEQV